MQSMQELKAKLRQNFRDDHGIQWSDALLDDILYEAQREYALYSGGLLGEHKVFTVNTPEQLLPDDFFEVVQVLDEDGRIIPVVSYRKLIEKYGDFRQHKGEKAKYFCFNFDSFGKFRIYPQLPAGTFAGTIVYKRIPARGEWAAENSTAIEHYAMFQMYQFTGKSLAQTSFKNFTEEILREKRHRIDAGNKNISRTGVYF